MDTKGYYPVSCVKQKAIVDQYMWDKKDSRKYICVAPCNGKWKIASTTDDKGRHRQQVRFFVE